MSLPSIKAALENGASEINALSIVGAGNPFAMGNPNQVLDIIGENSLNDIASSLTKMNHNIDQNKAINSLAGMSGTSGLPTSQPSVVTTAQHGPKNPTNESSKGRS